MVAAVALDCENVEVISNGVYKSAVARVSIVSENLSVLLDEYVKPDLSVSNYRTAITGITARDLQNGKNLEEIRRQVMNLIHGKILVGHDINSDLEALGVSHPNIRDTALKAEFMQRNNGQKPALKDLARDLLYESIQVGPHNPVEDARTAMKLYKKYPW